MQKPFVRSLIAGAALSLMGSAAFAQAIDLSSGSAVGPAGVYGIDVVVTSGSGGGGGSDAARAVGGVTTQGPGGQGGSGTAVTSTIRVQPGQTITVVQGAAGAGGENKQRNNTGGKTGSVCPRTAGPGI